MVYFARLAYTKTATPTTTLITLNHLCSFLPTLAPQFLVAPASLWVYVGIHSPPCCSIQLKFPTTTQHNQANGTIVRGLRESNGPYTSREGQRTLLLAYNAIVVSVVHVLVRRMAATDWGDTVVPCLRASKLPVLVVIPHGKCINVGRCWFWRR